MTPRTSGVSFDTPAKERTPVERQLAGAESEHPERNTNMSNSTSTVEVIPTLTPENFAEVKNLLYREAPTGLLDPKSDTRLYKVELPNITLDDGTPTEWVVDTEDKVMFLTTRIPCSFAGCRGHFDLEVEDEWEGFLHHLDEKPLSGYKPEKAYTADANFGLYSQGGSRFVSYRIAIEGEVNANNLGDLADWLDDTAQAVRVLTAEWVE